MSERERTARSLGSGMSDDEFSYALKAAGAKFMAGRYDETLQDSLALYAAVHGEPARLARVALLAAKTCWNAKYAEQGVHWSGLAIDAAALANNEALDAEAWALKGACHALAAQAALAVQCLDRAIRRLSPRVAMEVQRTVFTAVGLSYQYLGLFVPALGPLRRAYDIARGQTSDEGMLRCGVNLAFALVEAIEISSEDSGSERDALVKEAADLVGAMDQRMPANPSDQIFYATRDATARLLIACGDAIGARSRLQACLDRGSERRPHHLVSWLIDLAHAEKQLNLNAEASEHAAKARELLSEVSCPEPTAVEMRRLARLVVIEGNAEDTMTWMRRSHARIVRNEHAMLEARAAEFNVLESSQSMMLELVDLRRQREGLHEQFRALEQMSKTDALTGMLNRRALDTEYLALRGPGMHVALFDLDHFKLINDRHGHAVGDAVLREVSRLISETLRAADRAARYGGDEIAALLLDASDEGAFDAIERLRRRIEQHDWTRIRDGMMVTLSAGVTRVVETESLDLAIARADAALYRAKKEGRNRAVRVTSDEARRPASHTDAAPTPESTRTETSAHFDRG